MKFVYFSLLCILSSFVNADNVDQLIGEWEQFDTGSEKKYTYFRYNKDNSGIFATVRGDRPPSIDSFEASQVKVNDGIIEINFSESDKYKAKLLLAGYKSPANGIATGMLYMYMKDMGDWKIFNTIFIRLLKRNDSEFLFNINKLDSEIKELKK